MNTSLDARRALLSAYAFDMFPGPRLQLLEPPADPRLAAAWTIRAYITGCDALLMLAMPLGLGARVFYGFVAESIARPGVFVAVFRGTADTVEWAIDAKCLLVPCGLGGHAEDGFYRLWQTMRCRKPDGFDADLGKGIAQIVGDGVLEVIGHSLGGALATYTALDLVSNHGLADRLCSRLFASPRPGDQAFADSFAAHVKDAIAYAYERDRVPEIPLGFGYVPLHCLQLITRQSSKALIADDPFAAHHIYCYAAELDYGLMNWADVPLMDRPLTACILGPNPLLRQ
ncbi:MAG: hypothetical protein KGL39_15375 [Patescibacteria group bacterium]|nr:hypothetical protein [Patescibacteria group bacterium]